MKSMICRFLILDRRVCDFSSFCLRQDVSFDHVCCISFHTTEQGLSEAFSQHGQVIEANIVMDRVSDRSKGFGFVTYASEDEAENAIKEMNGKPLNGRAIFVDYAKPRSGFSGGMPIARGPPEPASEN
ncbi:RNA binding (RRM/RBD/RNP motif) family protein [Abeliophyllum distichum]|uniref:RNA binding (RRM/RBD/RNP motif) family protein n=1 Tax=Abeliophyllum distichum TaxID=126358 RepID=A0ABD1NRV1_9LAMI